MKGKPMDPLGMGSLQFLSRVAVHRSCHSCWDTARSSAMDTRQAARVARAETRSKLSNSMMMESPSVSLELWTSLKKKSCAEAFLDFGGKMCKSRSKFLEGFFFFLRKSAALLYALQKPSASDNRRLCLSE